ncbi:TonB-dependent receptor [Mucilaginibacter conchicola]|uniref:TonB-dependent receptor n=1 Tax=Mucilaginibacter conchicola TaxID=2303333 RepID=A0A372NWY9_9SPHI|nr:TonB-dependent receptor [Mucilaginibacter conchicola]RFZ94633.1 TonB-dependent receptor [Mucilaginibacter conchicola]
MRIFYMSVIFTLFVNQLLGQSKARLTGVVYDEHDKPLQGATITLEPDHRGAISSKSGRFTVNGLYYGSYAISVTAIGYQSHSGNVEIKENGSNDVTVKLITSTNALNDVNVSAKKYNPDNLIDMQRTPMQTTIISRQTIEQMGSRRLDEVLREQTGLAIVNDIGNGSRAVGLQMQGFGSGYVMILVDGQPMIGRNSGNFDLSRISVSNIERIEIIKGASSCLFGSEAMGGVVNIVTRRTVQDAQGLATLRYGTQNIIDATLQGETPFAGKRGSADVTANYYRTDGFNVNPYQSAGTTVPPYANLALQARGRYQLNDHNWLSLSGRYASRTSTNNQVYGSNTNTRLSDVLDDRDLNGSVILNTNFDSGLKLKSQYYLTRYFSDQGITNVNNYAVEHTRFTQYFHRAEVQAAKQYGQNLNMTGGIGGNLETMDNSGFTGDKQMRAAFIYAQTDWQLNQKIGVIAGSRLDYHDTYGTRLNPSLALSYKPVNSLTFKAAIGTGYKTPDYKQRFQIFTNPQAGYTVIGAEALQQGLQQLRDGGQLAQVWPIADRVANNLKAENSVSYNLSLNYAPSPVFTFNISGYYNDVHNLINSVQVATKSNGQQVFSYINVDRSALSGLETSINWKPVKNLTVNAGYQLLYAKDKGVERNIRDGVAPYDKIRNSATGETRPSKVSDYYGLENRSRHMANIRLFYQWEKAGINASLRANYRSKSGYTDANNNGFLDEYDIFIGGYVLTYATVEKVLFNKHLSVQITADNLFDYTDMLMPGQPGRQILAGVTWRFFKTDF